MQKSNLVKYVKACKEINIAFIPYEEQVMKRNRYPNHGEGGRCSNNRSSGVGFPSVPTPTTIQLTPLHPPSNDTVHQPFVFFLSLSWPHPQCVPRSCLTTCANRVPRAKLRPSRRLTLLSFRTSRRCVSVSRIPPPTNRSSCCI